MIVVMSDLHFQDTRNDVFQDSNKKSVPVERNISPDAFEQTFEEILTTADLNDAKEIIVVLAGDIFDINRSQKWLEQEIRPYGEHSVKQWGPIAEGIMDTIIESNGASLKIFRNFLRHRWKKKGALRLVYIPGNHDRLVNLYAPLRRKVRACLGYTKPNDAVFDNFFLSKKYGVIIRHGHEYDSTNFGRKLSRRHGFSLNPEDYSLPSLGDYATIDIGAGFPFEFKRRYDAEMRFGPNADVFQLLYCKLLEFDDLRPQSDIIDFILKDTPQSMNAWEFVLPVADAIITKAIGSRFLRSKLGAWGKLLPLLNLFPLSWIPTKFLIRRIGSSDAHGNEPWRYALREQALRSTEGRYVVAGHTHNPSVEYLKQRTEDGKELFFFDTGTWRQQIRKCRDNKTFARSKALTYIVFYSSQEDCHRVYGHKQYSFDYWSGFTKKEKTP